jgi:hypothetical protein
MKPGEIEESTDLGFPFLVVRMVLPSRAAVAGLAPDLRDRVTANIEKARRTFRSRTLPTFEADTRLTPSFNDLPSGINATILEGIPDESALAALALEPLSSDYRLYARIEIVTSGDDRIEIRHASELLGKYWYRHQEMDIFDAMKLVDDLKAARERGETGSDLPKPKPPAPPRRRLNN